MVLMECGGNHSSQWGWKVGHSIELTKIVDSGVAGISAGNIIRFIGPKAEVYAFGSDSSTNWVSVERSE